MAKKMLSGISAKDIAGLAVGAAAASKVATMGASSTNTMLQKAAPFLPLILGVFLMKKKGITGSIGMGMVAVGATKAIGKLAPNLGIGVTESISDYTVEGIDSNYALAGMEVEGMNEGMNGASSYALAGVDTNTDLVG
jgi:hypothetical protein